MPELSFNCSYCGVKIEADSTLAGKIIQCPKCSHAVKVSEGLMLEGTVLGGYSLEKLLGKGGMGEVWLATQTSMGRKVGLKILAYSLSKDPEFIARFNQEMKLVAKLDHPGIVSAYEAGYDKGFYFLATSYVDGATLESKIDAGKIFAEKEALAIARKVAEALKYAWDKHRILHRDIKPANIMIDNNGEVKLMDMGISKSLLEDKSITMTGSILGTPYYMSPEQAKAEEDIDHRTDIYSLGATLYHMITGNLPYNATTTMGVLARMISENVTPVREINPKISGKCEKLILKMMAKDKSKRHGTWKEVIDEIERVMDDRILDDELPESNRKPRMITSMVALLVIASASVLLIFLIVKQDYRESAYTEISIEDISPERGYAGNSKDSRKVNEDNVKKSSGVNPDSFDDKRPNGVPITEPVQISTGKKDEPNRFPNLKKALSENLGIPEEQAMRLIPIIREYGRALKQLRDNAPPAGYKLNELREKIHFITMNAKKQSETILTKEQSYKFVQFLEQERRQSFHNNFWRNPGSGTGNK